MTETSYTETTIMEKPQSGLEECKEEDFHVHIRPDFSSSIDVDTGEYEAEIYLPGVPKDSVKVKVLTDLFDLEARRDQVIYSLTAYFPYEIDVKTVTAHYDNGLLRLKGKVVDPFASAVEVKVE